VAAALNEGWRQGVGGATVIAYMFCEVENDGGGVLLQAML
jgi:hypothetical protein